MGFGSFTGFAIDFRRADRLIAHRDRPLLRTFLLEGVSEDREICKQVCENVACICQGGVYTFDLFSACVCTHAYRYYLWW